MKTIINVTPTPIITRADHDPGKGYPEPIRELRIAAGAAARHESRVRAAELALAKLVSCYEPGDGPSVVLGPEDICAAKLLAQLEIRGIGGELGLGRGLTSTSRMSWARSLGKGRRQASDGSTWDAALADAFADIEPALAEITPAMLVAAADVLEHGDLLWPQTYAMAMAYEADDPDTATAWYGAAVRLAVQQLLDMMLERDMVSLTRDDVWALLPDVDGGRSPRWLRPLLLDAAEALIEHGLQPGQSLPADVWPIDLPEPAPSPTLASGPSVVISGRPVLPEITGSISVSL